jgi:hypothetical protein
LRSFSRSHPKCINSRTFGEEALRIRGA